MDDKGKEKFFSRVQKTDTCWLWKGLKFTKTGYGCFFYKKKHRLTHRFSWEIHKGDIPAEMCVCHTCDIRLCVNPDHLWLGTHKDNQQDCIKKGRKISQCRFTKEEEIEILRLYNGGMTKKALHILFKADLSAINRALERGNYVDRRKRKPKIYVKYIVQRKYMELRDYFYKNNILIKDFADLLGMHPTHLSSCINGKKKFSRRIAYKIREVTKGEVQLEEYEPINKQGVRK